MFADAHVELPKGTGTRSPEDVAAAVLRAVRENPAEIDVAAIEQVLGARLSGIAPTAMIGLQRWLGGEDTARKLADGQKHKR
jgi:hypothetical protein